MSGLRCGILFRVIWFVSFVLAWRIFLSSFRSQLPFSLSQVEGLSIWAADGVRLMVNLRAALLGAESVLRIP